jgi:hypothetical protein
MIFIQGGTLLRPKQIRLTELFTVERVLASRGFEVAIEGDGLDTLIARSTWSREEADLVFQIFDDRSKRKKLLECIGGNRSFDEDADLDRLSVRPDFNSTRQAFSHTFEWYVGELLTRRFGAFSSSYGVEVQGIVRNSDGGTVGDYDVLSVLGTTEVLYIECKSGRFTGSKITNMLERARSLHVQAAIMFVDIINQNSLKAQLTQMTYPGINSRPELLKMSIKHQPESQIYQWHDAFFVDASGGDVDVTAKIRAVLRLVECKKAELSRGVGIGDEDYSAAGYEFSKV